MFTGSIQIRNIVVFQCPIIPYSDSVLASEGVPEENGFWKELRKPVWLCYQSGSLLSEPNWSL